MNWGTGIALFFAFFATSMILAVVASTRHKPQLVQQDYYALDLNYQAHMDKKQNAAALARAPQVRFDVAKQTIRVTLPDGMVAETGSVKCYRPATTRDDLTVAMQEQASVDVPAASLASGRWHVELDWQTADGRTYFYETSLFLAQN
jgi:nitrogen fixation protein FixH